MNWTLKMRRAMHGQGYSQTPSSAELSGTWQRKTKFWAYICAEHFWICNREIQTLATGMMWKYPAFHLFTSQPCVPLPARQISKQAEISGDSGGISCAAPGYLLIEAHQPKISNRILLSADMLGFWADIHWSCLLLIISCQNSKANIKSFIKLPNIKSSDFIRLFAFHDIYIL